MNYQPTKSDASEAEILTADEQKLNALLGGLKRVEAPKDFDFKLKAKIAAGNLADEKKRSYFPALRYIFPLLLIVLLSGFAALRIFAPNEATEPVTVADGSPPANKIEIAVSNTPERSIGFDAPPTADLNTDKAAPPTTVGLPKAASNVKQTPAAVKSPEKRGAKRTLEPRNIPGGSYDIGGGKPSNSINVSANNPNAGQSGKIDVRQMLDMMGIEVEFVGANCQVKSVREGTAARIADFQPGDLIEAIDDKKLSSETAFSDSFKGKVFRVVRAGKLMVIDLTKR